MESPEVFILDRDLERIGIVPEYASLVWVSRMWDHSSATMSLPIDGLPQGAHWLQRTDTDEAMKIRRKHLVVKGKSRHLEIGAHGGTIEFEKRVNWWTKSWADANLATAASELAADAQATYLGLDRTIHKMGALIDLTGATIPISKQISWGSVSEAIFGLVRAKNLRFGVRYQDGMLRPFIAAGVDRSADVVFSTDYDDLASADIDIDHTESANVAVVGGQGELAARTVTVVEVPDGEDLAELWVDADDLSPEEAASPADYLAQLQHRGTERIADLPVTLSAEGIATDDRYRYREDYDLGDIVAFRAFGLEVSDVISEVTETIEKGEVRVELSLGKTAPTIRKLLR